MALRERRLAARRGTDDAPGSANMGAWRSPPSPSPTPAYWPTRCCGPRSRERRAPSNGAASRLGRLLGDDAGRELLFTLTDEVLRTDDARRATRRLARLVGGGLPRALGPIDRAGLRLAALVGGAAPAAIAARRAGTRPRRNARRDPQCRRSRLRGSPRAATRRRHRLQRQPARRSHPRRRRGGRAPRRRRPAAATPRRAVRVGEGQCAVREPRRARVRRFRRADRRATAPRVPNRGAHHASEARLSRHGGVPRPPRDRRGLPHGPRRTRVPVADRGHRACRRTCPTRMRCSTACATGPRPVGPTAARLCAYGS